MTKRAKRLEIRLTDREDEALTRLAEKDQRTKSDIVRLAIRAYIAEWDQ